MPNKNKSIDMLSEKLAKVCQDIENDVRKSIPEPPPEQRFISVKQKRDKAGLEIREAMLQLQTLLAKGMTAIIEALNTQKKEEQAEEILNWFTDHADSIGSYMDSKDESLGNRTLQEVLKFPPQLLAAMHQAAIYLLNEHRLDEAIAAMTVCLQINSTLSPLWFTYAQILQSREDQEAAIYAFNVAAILDEENPYIYAHLARSWIALGEWQQALDTLGKAKTVCDTHPDYTDLTTYIKELEEWMDTYQKKNAVKE